MMKRKNRVLQLEHLQSRDLMTVESLAWDGASSLRLSFVPDGTRVADQVSYANAALSQSAAGANWKRVLPKPSKFGLSMRPSTLALSMIAAIRWVFRDPCMVMNVLVRFASREFR